MKKPIIALVAVAIVAAVIIAYYFTHRSESGKDRIRISGNIEVTSVEVSFKIPGRVAERLVDEGILVKAGQVIARLESEDLTHDVAFRQADLQAMQAALDELLAGSRKEEIAQAEAVLAEVEAEAKRLADDFHRQEALFRREVIPRQKFDAARAAYDTSRAQVRQASQALALLRQGPRRERIDQARARRGEAEVSLAQAKTRLGYTTLASPVSGLVIAKNIEPGEQVAAGTPVVTVGELDSVWVRAYINETDLGRVKVGQKARVSTDTWPGKAYEGIVTFISSEAEFTPKNVQTQKERVKLVYRVKITIPNPNMELKPGMPADAEILTGMGDGGSGTGK
ncbi:MAG TPA: efflux RND transporter periplasmic adaptor subunit [Geobacteraceae bacterium]|nr:efflux RND transporter periplasmic adaptor subunit [Geobacteraceae bacterium]